MIARPAVKKTPDSLLLVEIKSYKMDNISFYFSMYNSDLHYNDEKGPPMFLCIIRLSCFDKR
jgi:hypothetical protein